MITTFLLTFSNPAVQQLSRFEPTSLVKMSTHEKLKNHILKVPLPLYQYYKSTDMHGTLGY